MTPRSDILDHNLTLLLQRAYRPVQVDADFRAGLEERFRVELRRVHGAPSPSSVPEPRTPVRQRSRLQMWTLVGAAAALLIAVISGAFGALFENDELRTSPDHLLANGEIAVAFAGESWRVASQREQSSGINLERAGVEIAVPEGRQIDVQSALQSTQQSTQQGASVKVIGPSRVAVSVQPWLVNLRLGTVSIAHIGSEASASRLIAGVGTLVLSQGTVEVERQQRYESFVLAMDPGASASYEGPKGRIALTPGEVLTVIDGSPVTKTDVDPNRDPNRSAVETPEPGKAVTDPAANRALSGSVHGSVHDADGEPVRAFTIAVLRVFGGRQFTTAMSREVESEDGRFDWSGLDPGKYRFYVQAEGYAIYTAAGEFQIGAGAPLPPIEATLVRGGTLRGFVLDAKTSMPVGDALVLAERDAPQSMLPFRDADRSLWLPTSTRTRADGSFELANVTAGEHRLRCSATDYAPRWTEEFFTVEAGAVTSGCEFAMMRGGTLTGIVSRADGTPWAGAILSVGHPGQPARPQMHVESVRSEADGRYRLTCLPEGIVYVVFGTGADGTEPRVEMTTIHDGQESVLDFGVDTSKTRVRGRLLDADGNPRAHIDLGLIPEKGDGADATERLIATSTDARGMFAFDEVPLGSYMLFTAFDSHVDLQYIADIQVAAGQTGTIEIRCGRCTIRGQVFDGRNGEAWPTAGIVLWKIGGAGEPLRFAGSNTAASDGKFQLQHLLPGRYRITAYSAGELGHETSHEIEVGDQIPDAEVDFQLLAGGVVDVTVVDDKDKPVGFATVTFVDGQGLEHDLGPEEKTDLNGRFAARGLRAEVYTVVVHRAGFATSRTEFTCRVGTAKLRIQLTHD